MNDTLNDYEYMHEPWQPMMDILGNTKDFKPLHELTNVISFYRRINRLEGNPSLRWSGESVKITTNAIDRMMEKMT